MCGIAGYMNFDKQNNVEAELVHAMTEKLNHRGPDGEGYFIEKNVGLGHKRLSIIDIQTGQQPMKDASQQYVLVYNGELYNYTDLRNELIKAGRTFETSSDTEVVLQAYIEWGNSCVTKFNGMWALAVYNKNENSLFLSRDRFGIKPLYYFEDEKKFLFASEIKAFSSCLKFEINKEELWDEMVYGPKDGGKTWVNGINELLPGHNMVVKHGIKKMEPYYHLEDTFGELSGQPDITAIETLLSESIAYRLMADVPLGTLNSGGVDSSVISAIAQNKTKEKLHTFSVAPELVNGKPVTGDESVFADKLGAYINSSHSIVRYNQQSFIGDLEKAIYYNDGLLIHSNSIPMSFLFEQIKNKYGIKVLQSGEGADEIFRGYSVNKQIVLLKYLHFIPILGPLLASKAIDKLYNNKLEGLANSFSQLHQLFILRNSQVRPSIAKQVLGIQHDVLTEDRLRLFNTMKSLPELEGGIWYEQKCYLAGLLKRIDRMSMRWGVEVRVPFLDHRLVEVLNKIPFHLKTGLKDNNTKKILRKIAQNHVPDEIAYRKKYSFASPIMNYRNTLNNLVQESEKNTDQWNDQELFLTANAYLLMKMNT